MAKEMPWHPRIPVDQLIDVNNKTVNIHTATKYHNLGIWQGETAFHSRCSSTAVC
jgi:hypothetical protein